MPEQFPSDRDEIKRVVSKRLCAAEDQPIVESEMGPAPFQDEPLERWLFEGYLRAYRLEPIQHQAFWEGVADAVFNLLPLDDARHLGPLLRCSRLLARIGLRFTAKALQQEALHKRTVLSAHVADRLGFSIDKQTLALQTMARIALWLSPAQAWTLQWDKTIEALVAHAQNHWDELETTRKVELLALVSQTYAIWGRRNGPMQTQIKIWKQTIDAELLEIYQTTMDDFFQRTGISPKANWCLAAQKTSHPLIEKPPRLLADAANNWARVMPMAA
jgi:hypothetical protein